MNIKVKTVCLIESNLFSKSIEVWAHNSSLSLETLDSKTQDIDEFIDGVVVFHENHNISKEIEDLQLILDSANRPGHRIDINGTLAATKSNFEMWLERNKPSKLLFLGKNDLPKNKNLQRFLENLM
jgi:hypothetical protein